MARRSTDADGDEAATWRAFHAYMSLPTATVPAVTLQSCASVLLDSGRPSLLALLKESGVSSLSERQRLAGAIGKATKSLWSACESGDADSLRATLLCVDRSHINMLSGCGSVTPLMAAASAGHVSCSAQLLEASAVVDGTRSMGLTALMISSIKGTHACTQLLLKAAASVDRTDEDGWSSLLYASIHGHAGCVRTLLDGRANP